jgi:hypothetical protein
VTGKFPICLLATACLYTSSCAGWGIGTEIKDKEKYLGCYKYGETPILSIGNDEITIRNGDSNTIEGFSRIKSNDYVLTKNSIRMNNNGDVKFGRTDTGFQYRFRQTSQATLLILHNDAGHEFQLAKDGRVCK